MEERIHNGEWTGAWEGDKPVVTLNGTTHDARDVARHMGLKIKNVGKYRKEHADMEQTLHSGHTEDSGDGISESEE